MVSCDRDQLANGRSAAASLASDSFLRPSFTLEQLRTFLAVASREHVTHAAKALRLSQPAVTQQVQLLERALGVRLLERVGRRVRLTGAGVEVASACLLVMRSLENIEAVAQALRGLDIGSVTLGASQLAADYFLPPLMRQYAGEHPRINVGVGVAGPEQVEQQVAAGHVDCGLVDGNAPPPELHLTHVQIATTDVVLVAHPRDLPEPDGAGEPAGLPPGLRYLEWQPPATTQARIADLLGVSGDPLPRLELGSMEAARRLVRAGEGFATALPAVAVREEIRDGTLTVVCRHPEPLPILALRRSGPDSPAVEALWRLMSQPSPVEPTAVSAADTGHFA